MVGEQDGAAGFDLRLLGPFEVTRGGGAVELGGPQQRAVLAHLALSAGRVVAVDRLITRLWGEEPPASALGTLQSYVSRLRRALEPGRKAGTAAGVLVSEAPGYVLRVGRQAVDVFRFEDLAAEARSVAERGHAEAAVERFDAALAMWRGPALAGLGDESSLDPVIVRLEEERANVVEDRFDALLALGRHASAVGELQEAVTEQPLRERLWGQLALALYRSRRQADALRALATARSTLAEELGLDPGPDLQRLERQILAHDPALVAAQPVAARAVAPIEPSAPLADSPMVGRDRERAVLAQTITRASSGRPGLVLLEGEAGIGKTTLLDALVAEARARGWRAAWGRCVEEGLAPALWPWIEVARAVGDERGADGLAPYPALTALVTRTDDAEGERTATLVQLADEIAALLAAAARAAPRLVVLDDLHWGDSASLELLPLVAARLGEAPVLVAGSHRPLDLGAGGPLAAALGALARLPATTRVALAGLDGAAVAALMTSLRGEAPSADLVSRVVARTAGNPLFVAELARLTAAPGGAADDDAVPEAVRDVVRRRLSRLPERTLTVLGVAAVLGQDVDLRVLTAASGLSPDECLDDLDPAMVTRVLVPADDGSFRFGHALVRDAVLVDLSPLKRARLHLKAADALAAVFGDDRDQLEPIAIHRWEAAAVADPLLVAQSLTRAGDVAARRGALDRADELLDKALTAARRVPAGDPRVDLEIEAIESVLTVMTLRSFMGGGLDEMAERIDEVARRNDSDAARQLALLTRWSYINQGLVAESEPYAVQALHLARRSESPYLVILGEYMWGVQTWVTGRLPEAGAHFSTALSVLEAAKARPNKVRLPPINVAGIAVFAFAVAGDDAEVDRCVRGLQRWFADRPHDPTAPIDVAFTHGFLAAIRGDAASALEHMGPLSDPAAPIQLPHFSPALRAIHGWARTVTGDEGGLQAAAEALAEIDAGTIRIGVPAFRAFHGAALLHAGQIERAIEVLAQARHDAETTHDQWWLPEMLRLLGVAHGALGAATDADRLLAAAVELAEAQFEPLLADRARATQVVIG